MMNKYYFKRKIKDAHSEEKQHRKKSTRSKPNLTKKLDKVFSAYIRLRDAMPSGYFKCPTCGRILPFEKGDCSHYWSRVHMATRFDEQNCCMECNYDNRMNSSHLHNLGKYLEKKLGKQGFDLLEWKHNQPKKWSDFELQAMIDYYTKEAKKLSTLKGIKIKI